MSNDNTLAVLDELKSQVPAIPDDTFNDLVGEQNNYSTRLQLFSFASGPCQTKEIEAGHFAIVNGQTLDDLGEEIVIIPIGIRCKAMDLSGEKPVIAYDQNGSLFADIRLRSTGKDSNCMCGVEFLVYVPDRDAFTTFFLANKTLLREAGNVKANLGTAIKCKSKHIKKDKMNWHGMTVVTYPIEVKQPSRERTQSEIRMFISVRDMEAQPVQAVA